MGSWHASHGCPAGLETRRGGLIEELSSCDIALLLGHVFEAWLASFHLLQTSDLYHRPQTCITMLFLLIMFDACQKIRLGGCHVHSSASASPQCISYSYIDHPLEHCLCCQLTITCTIGNKIVTVILRELIVDNGYSLAAPRISLCYSYSTRWNSKRTHISQ